MVEQALQIERLKEGSLERRKGREGGKVSLESLLQCNYKALRSSRPCERNPESSNLRRYILDKRDFHMERRLSSNQKLSSSSHFLLLPFFLSSSHPPYKSNKLRTREERSTHSLALLCTLISLIPSPIPLANRLKLPSSPSLLLFLFFPPPFFTSTSFPFPHLLICSSPPPLPLATGC